MVQFFNLIVKSDSITLGKDVSIWGRIKYFKVVDHYGKASSIRINFYVMIFFILIPFPLGGDNILKVVTLKSQGLMSCVACPVLVKTSKQQYFVYIYF